MAENNKKEYNLELYEQPQQTIPSMWVQSSVEHGEDVIIFETGDVSHVKLNMENILKLRDFIEQWIKDQTLLVVMCQGRSFKEANTCGRPPDWVGGVQQPNYFDLIKLVLEQRPDLNENQKQEVLQKIKDKDKPPKEM